jgi:lysine-N-methylase
MSLPIRHLPVLQNWECRGCTDCCREYRVHVTEDERRRIESQGWDQDPELVGQRLFVAEGPFWARGYRLYQHPDGRCVFLSEQGRCRIHERFGAEAKPFPCRLYPFVLVPAGDHWRVGLRYACPSAARNQGRPLAAYEKELAGYAAALEGQHGVDGRPVPPPALRHRQHVDWPDLLTFARAVVAVLRNPADRMERRWRKVLALAALCRQARFDQVAGSRLGEFLSLVGATVGAETPEDPHDVPPPNWAGRILFRQALALYGRKDLGPGRGLAARGRAALLWAAWRFALGRGAVPRVHGLLPETTFERVEVMSGPLPPPAEAVLERYYRVKVESLQFCGPNNFGMAFWDGLESLALTVPAVFWLARAFGDLSRQEAVTRAIGIVDNNFGFNRLLGSRRHRLALNILARRGELTRLIAWYGR